SLKGWGWQDGAYWLNQTTTIKFATTGTHTIRVQTREDGVSVDQIILSSARYLTTAPGAPTNDPTRFTSTTTAGTPAPTPAPGVVAPLSPAVGTTNIATTTALT